MTDIRYVILSDLHFGAANSVLTALSERPASPGDSGFSADPQRPSPLLRGLVDGLRTLTRDQDRPPTLILAASFVPSAPAGRPSRCKTQTPSSSNSLF